MAYEHSIQRYRNWYANLLRLYPGPYHERFGEGMEQTFSDLLHECAGERRGLFTHALWMFVETSMGIIKQNTMYMITQKRTYVFVVGMLALLLVPFFAMQFQIEGVDWDGADFGVAAALLIGFGFALAAATNGEFPMRRRLIGIAAFGLLFLLYVHLAVGIVDTWPLAGS
jgi:hypothetical protein